MTNVTRKGIWLASLLAIVGVGCDDGPDANVPDQGPPPVSGGGLEIVGFGAYAVASDPARAAIHVVDLDRGADRRIDLTAEDEPGRIVEDRDGNVHVVLRRAGDVLSIDPSNAAVLRRRAVCAAPRGIALDPDVGDLVVACAEGQLVRLPATEGGVTSRVTLEPDLRDVIAYPGGRMLVSRFRSAEVLVVREGAIVQRVTPPEVDDGFRTLSATVGWRMRPTPDEGAVFVHQHSVSSQLGRLGGSSGVYYGGDCDTGVVRTAISRLGVDWTNDEVDVTGVAVQQLSLGVDVDVADSDTVVVVGAAEPSFPTSGGGIFGIPGSGFAGPREISMRDLSRTPRCTFDERFRFGGGGEDATDPATAVAAMPGGGYAVLYRDPARLELNRPDGTVRDIALDGGDVTHIGHALFHEAAGTGATCAGCHPEGGEDGHVWAFETGARRSQTLLGGILSTLPFHWDGQVESASAVMDGTFVGRMGGEMPRADEVDSFAHWMDALPALPGAVVEDADAVERGRLLFERADVGCTSCHSGDLRTNNQTVDVGTADELGRSAFQVPALYEVAYHAPYMHDGRAGTLAEVVETHGGGGTLSDSERADMVAYLRSL